MRIDMAGMNNFLLDMDGAMYLVGRLFEAAPDFLERLRNAGRKILFLTNNSSRSVIEYGRKLTDMGLKVSLVEISTSNFGDHDLFTQQDGLSAIVSGEFLDVGIARFYTDAPKLLLRLKAEL